MLKLSLLTLSLSLIPAAAQARQTVGVYKGWAAFRDATPQRCYAVAAPDAPGTRGAFASVANWPQRRVPSQLHIRMSRPMRAGSAILLTIDGRVFQLGGAGIDAWAPGRAADRAIVSAMRTGVTMSVAARDERGAGYSDVYRLSGAATAIDAAALACRKR